MWTVNDVLEGCEGRFEGTAQKTSAFNGFSIDTRTIQKNNLFFALSGPHFDGHRFVEDALRKGSGGAVVSQSVFHTKKEIWFAQKPLCAFILVDDPLLALQRLAKWHRKRFSLPVVGITGSNGKTSTKEMTAAILKQQETILKTEGNLNNHIGVPLTLLSLTTEHTAAVIEMGINQKGEMAQLSNISQPTMGLITNIGPAHLEGLGTLAGVAAEKTVLFESLQEDGTAIINADDPFLKPWKDRLSKQSPHKRTASWTFSIHSSPEPRKSADITATDIVLQKDTTTFTLHHNRLGESIGISLPVSGKHHVSNALGAATVAAALGISLKTISTGLSRFQPLSQRTEVFKIKGVTLLFDAYNANPASVEAALDLLAAYPREKGLRIALLGEMFELGDFSAEFHNTVGRQTAAHGIDRLIAIGPSAQLMANGARTEGMPDAAISAHSDLSTVKVAIEAFVRPNDILLIKGSRGMKLERILPFFGLSETGERDTI